MDAPGDWHTLGRVHNIHDANTIAHGGPVRPEPRPAPAHHLLLLDARTVTELRGRVAHLTDQVRGSGPGGLGDVAESSQRGLAGRPVRAGVVAASAEQACERLDKLAAALRGGAAATFDVADGVFAGDADRADGEPRIGYLFPGQGSTVEIGGDALTGRFETARDFYRTVPLPAAGDPRSLGAAQPRIVASSATGVRVLSGLGIEASVAAGHSLGELTALQWAGAMSEAELPALAAAHGQILADVCTGDGMMAVVTGSRDEVEPLLRGETVAIAGYNNPAQTVVAGPAEAFPRVRRAAVAAGLKAARLPVPDAFHTPVMAPAAEPLRAYLAGRRFRPLERRVVSTVTGDVLPPDTDLRDLLVEQLCTPVMFSQAVQRMAGEVSLIIEVGPGRLLSVHAARACPDVPVVPLAADEPSLSGVLCAAAAAYVLGAPVRHERLVAGSTV